MKATQKATTSIMTMDLKDKRNSHLENQEVKADMSHL
jgi:hypothetical protein